MWCTFILCNKGWPHRAHCGYTVYNRFHLQLIWWNTLLKRTRLWLQSSIFALNCNTGEVEIIFITWLRLSALRPEISKCKQRLWAKAPCWGSAPGADTASPAAGGKCRRQWSEFGENSAFFSFFFFLDHSFPGRDKLPDIPLTGAGRPSRHGGVISAPCFSMLCLAMHISYTENGWYAENYLPLYFLKHKQKSTFCSNHHHSEGTMSDCERAWSKEKLCRNS